MKKALIHDWFSTYAGAEKCVESFTNVWGDFEIYSLIDFLSDADRNKILKGKRAHTSFIQKLPFAKDKYRNYLPLFPLAIEQFSGRDGVVHFNPYRVEDMRGKIQMVLNDENLQNELHIKGFENIKIFSWEESVQKIINLVNKL